VKPKPLTIETLWELRSRVLQRSRRDAVSIPAMPQFAAGDFGSKPSSLDPMPAYEFAPVLCDDGVWRHKFTGEVIL
jgi:hypothetical protein